MTLAEQGQGIGIVPSVVDVRRARAHVAPLLHRGKPIGNWTRVIWDSRRYLPPYAEALIDLLTTWTKTRRPGGWVCVLRSVPPPTDDGARLY